MPIACDSILAKSVLPSKKTMKTLHCPNKDCRFLEKIAPQNHHPFWFLPNALGEASPIWMPNLREKVLLQYRNLSLLKTSSPLQMLGLRARGCSPYPDRARPYIVSAQFPSHQASRPLCKPKSFALRHLLTLFQRCQRSKRIRLNDMDRCLWVLAL